MPRRKQSQPKANTGPVEQRQEVDEFALEENANNLALDEWEEKNAYVVRRPSKKQKISGLKLDENLDGSLNIDAINQWEIKTIPLEHVAQKPINQSIDSINSLGKCMVQIDDSDESTIAINQDFHLFAPNPPTATAFLHLLHSKHIILSTIRHDALNSRAQISIGLNHSKIFQAVAISPDDQHTKVYHTRLLTILRWLLPKSYGLDPYEDFPEDAIEVASIPLCRNRDPKMKSSGDIQHCTALDPTMNNEKNGPKTTTISNGFDAVELYAAVKPTGNEEELSLPTPQLKPMLRSYQKRAAHWMVQRECDPPPLMCLDNKETGLHPLWRRIECISPGKETFYINPYSGLVSLERFVAPLPPKGGIACDEMGLGKTVEVLALISAHPYKGSPPTFSTASRCIDTHDNSQAHINNNTNKTKKKKKTRQDIGTNERIDCVCGAIVDSGDYDGLWIQCNSCTAWLHGTCVGHPHRAPKGDFICGPCLKESANTRVTQPCGTTLIICPDSILPQWISEINRHTADGAFKVLVYCGQNQPGSHSKATGNGSIQGVVTAEDLAKADIVVTTFNVLRKDLHLNPSIGDEEGGEGNSHGTRLLLRRRKRYEVVPTPLTRLVFWRVVIDEAQMVDNSTAKAAEMAMKLKSEHRWCISGTPISRGLEDLHGLLAFLRVEPYSHKYWWNKCIQIPYEQGKTAARARLLALLKPHFGGLLWRSAKADVKDELGLPAQHHHLSHLSFSAVERFFYTRQHQECIGAANNVLSASTLATAQTVASSLLDVSASESPSPVKNIDQLAQQEEEEKEEQQQHQGHFNNRPLTQREEHKLLQPLLRLRQACVHSQVGSAGIRALTHRRPMKEAEVLDVLISSQKIEAEEAQRILVASLNGLAGIFLLESKDGVKEAVRAYREVLKIVEDNNAYIRVDRLQKLHTLHNLAHLLENVNTHASSSSSLDVVIGRTLKDSSLKEEAEILKMEYLAEHVAKLDKADKEMNDAWSATEAIKEKLRLTVGKDADVLLNNWWISACHLITHHTNDTGNAIVADIKTVLDQREIYNKKEFRNAASWATKFRDISGLQRILTQECTALSHAYEQAMKSVKQLQQRLESPTLQLIEMAATCMLCRAETARQGNVCEHCKLDDILLSWEVRLFSIKVFSKHAGITMEDAVRAARRQGYKRVGLGGLGEASALEEGWEPHGNAFASSAAAAAPLLPTSPQTRMGSSLAPSSLRQSEQRNDVTDANIVHLPSQSELALKGLASALRSLPSHSLPPGVVARRDLLIVIAQAHIELLSSYKKEFLRVNSMLLAQRLKLYAHDELYQCTMRMRLRVPGETIANELEGLFKIHEAELPVKNAELSADKAIAQSQLKHALGKLRFLISLKQKHDHAVVVETQHNSDRAISIDADGLQHKRGETGVDATTFSSQRTAHDTAALQMLNHTKEKEEKAVIDDDDNDNDVCPICHDSLLRSVKESAMLPCGHRLCCQCMLSIEQRVHLGTGSGGGGGGRGRGHANHIMMMMTPDGGKKVFPCPTCRSRVRIADVAYIEPTNTVPKHALDSVDDNSMKKKKEMVSPGQREELGGGKEVQHCHQNNDGSDDKNKTIAAADDDNKNNNHFEDAQVQLKEHFSTKLDAIVCRLIAILNKDAMCRILVFSGWKDALDVVSYALNANGVKHLYPKGSKQFQSAVAQFRDDDVKMRGEDFLGDEDALTALHQPEPRILLMLTKQGGNGLNLQQAQHVVFIEGLLDPAEEAQCIGRVDRIGQVHDTHVHRFVVSGTIEENVHCLVRRRAASMDLAASSVGRNKSARGENKNLTVGDVALLLLKRDS